MANESVDRTVGQIKQTLDSSKKPMTTGELANAIGVTQQTIRNHITTAINKGYAKHSEYRKGKAFLYESTTVAHNNLPTVRRGDDYIILRDVLIQLTNPDTYKNWLYVRKSAYTTIAVIIQKLFIRAANAHDENSPTPVAMADLKMFKLALREERAHASEVILAIDSLLNNEDLWDPKVMPKVLLVQDDELIDSESVRDILGRIIK